MNEHRWLDDVPAYVLGTLEAGERETFEVHLSGCGACQEAVREHERVTAALAGHVPSEDPPADLKARVLGAAFGDAHRGAPLEAPPPSRGRLPRTPTWAPWLAAAAGIGFAIWAGLASQESAATADRLAAEIVTARATIDTLRLESARRDSMLAALTGPSIRTATLTGTGEEPRVRLFWNRGSGQLLVTAFDLPAPPAGRTYQLWGLAPDAAPVSLGTFDTDPDGRAVALRPLPAGTMYAQSAVTEEPAGGSAQPTSQPFLVGPWSDATQ